MKSNIEQCRRCWKTHKYVFLHTICALSIAASASQLKLIANVSFVPHSNRIFFFIELKLALDLVRQSSGCGMGKDETDWDKEKTKESMKKRTEKTAERKKLTYSMFAALYVSDLLSPRVFLLLLHSLSNAYLDYSFPFLVRLVAHSMHFFSSSEMAELYFWIFITWLNQKLIFFISVPSCGNSNHLKVILCM